MSQLELRRLLYLQEKNQRVLENYQRRLEETNQKLMTQSLTDDVTGFHNTRFLHQYLDKVVDELKQMSLVFFDMDDFKTVVDTHGHLIGAEVLREVAEVVNQNLDTQDRIIRYGGDEFVVILPNQGRSRALSKAERMKEAISSALFIFEGNIQIKVTASFGLAVFPDDAKDRKQLLLEADQCLFQSKQEGKNRISSKSNLSKRS
jgi:diguanylate cyclase (GGDEF)-like protein